jgi:hypothetical protein
MVEQTWNKLVAFAKDIVPISDAPTDTTHPEDDLDPTIFAQPAKIITRQRSEFEFAYTVTNPYDNGSFVLYQTRGRDKKGFWECRRRYNNFV